MITILLFEIATFELKSRSTIRQISRKIFNLGMSPLSNYNYNLIKFTYQKSKGGFQKWHILVVIVVNQEWLDVLDVKALEKLKIKELIRRNYL